ncbi:MAG: hypothetical protein ACI4C0_07635 [Lachnospiraceae bacterium]
MDSSHPSVEVASNFASTSTASVVSGSVSSTTSSVSSVGASSVVASSAGVASSVVPPQPTNKDCFEISVLISSAFIKSYLVDNFLHKKE